MWYDKEEDILGVQVSKGDYWKSIELGKGVVADISREGKVLGFEISNAKKLFSGEAKVVLERARA